MGISHYTQYKANFAKSLVHLLPKCMQLSLCTLERYFCRKFCPFFTRIWAVDNIPNRRVILKKVWSIFLNNVYGIRIIHNKECGFGKHYFIFSLSIQIFSGYRKFATPYYKHYENGLVIRRNNIQLQCCYTLE